jgi:hypothetical protein
MPNLAQRIVESLDKKACIDETESLHFWLWDPIGNDENPYLEEDKPTIYRGQLLFTPSKRQRDESLEIICNTGGLKSCLFIDNCIFGEKDGKRCDAALLRKNDKEIVWIELKMGMKVDGKSRTQRLKNRLFGESEDDPKGAFAQILASKTHFSSGFDLSGTK